ncbi:MAG: hypothetical protein WC635_10355 [Bacteriovorax sp.]|jgi:hypothetical protein
MKLALILALSLTSILSYAETIKSTRVGTKAEISRVVESVKVYAIPDLQVNVTVKDMGGSTDVSPTQELFFTLYSKGEMYSTDATFKLGVIYDFKSAKKISNGVFEVFIGGVDFDTNMPKNKLLIIDAQKAIEDILKVRCTDFDCPASKQFKTSINIIEK